MARREEEKKSQGGQTLYDAVLHIYETQLQDISPNFEDNKLSRKFPGLIR